MEAIKTFISYAVTESIGFASNDREHGMKLDFIDIRRAYYYSKASRDVYVELPPGDDQERMCGLLNKSLQGARHAAQNWEATYTEFLNEWIHSWDVVAMSI